MITGAVDAVERLPESGARAIVDVAIGWRHKSARKAALERLYSWGEAARAYAIAARDPDAPLRNWATKLQAGGGQDALFE